MAKQRRQGRIPPPATTITQRIGDAVVGPARESTDHLHPAFRFGRADKSRHCLHDWQKEEIRALVDRFGYMESMTWLDVKKTGGQGRSSGGLGYKKIDRNTIRHHLRQALESLLPPDADLHEFRASLDLRVFGYRVDEIFYIIWFDREHAVTD